MGHVSDNVDEANMLIVICFLLGTIPLRQLVYRVLDLPPSLRPLVYDFGQLNMENENSYIEQIVKDHVCSYICMSIPSLKMC